MVIHTFELYGLQRYGSEWYDSAYFTIQLVIMMASIIIIIIIIIILFRAMQLRVTQTLLSIYVSSEFNEYVI